MDSCELCKSPSDEIRYGPNILDFFHVKKFSNNQNDKALSALISWVKCNQLAKDLTVRKRCATVKLYCAFCFAPGQMVTGHTFIMSTAQNCGLRPYQSLFCINPCRLFLKAAFSISRFFVPQVRCHKRFDWTSSFIRAKSNTGMVWMGPRATGAA